MDKSSLTGRYKNRLAGYENFVRQDYMLYRILGLSDSEMLLYKLVKDIVMDWDKKHTHTFGSFTFDVEQYQYYLGWSKSKIYKIFRRLCSLGLVNLVKKDISLYAVTGAELSLEVYKGKESEVLGEAYLRGNKFAYIGLLEKEVQRKRTSRVKTPDVVPNTSKSSPELSDLSDSFSDLTIEQPTLPTNKPLSHPKYRGDIVSSRGEFNTEEEDKLSTQGLTEEDVQWIEDAFNK